MGKIKKYKYKGLAFEVTKRCNLRCEHCMRGEAEDESIKKEVIDRVFDCVADCEQIMFIGGEPLLEIDAIEYIIDMVIKSNWTTKLISVVTNGTIEDDRIVTIFNRFCESAGDRGANIQISFDKFHDIGCSASAFVFYKEAEKNPRFRVMPLNIMGKQGEPYELIYSGRAKEYIREHPEQVYPEGRIIPVPSRNIKHRATIIHNTVFCWLEVCPDGEIIFADDSEYKDEKKLSLGNIVHNDLNMIIDNNNANCLFLCKEVSTWLNCVKAMKSPQSNELNRVIADDTRMVIESIWRVRELAHSTYAHIPVEVIIEMTSSLLDDEWIEKTFSEMYENSDYFNNPSVEMLSVDKQFVDSFVSQTGTLSKADKLLWMKALAINSLLNDGAKRKSPYMYFGDKSDILSSKLFMQFDSINGMYKRGEAKQNSYKVFPCDGMLDIG